MPLQAYGGRFGNLGVSLTQLFIPMVCSFAAFGGSAVSEEAGVYPHNSGFLYAPSRLQPEEQVFVAWRAGF